MSNRLLRLLLKPRWRLRFAMLCLMAFYLIPRTLFAVESSELIRASIIGKVAHFITWPSISTEEFNLCVSSKAPLLPAIQSYFVNETLASKPVRVVMFDRIDTVNECQIVYVNTELKEQLAAILSHIQQLPILIVDEYRNAAEEGAHVDFYIDDNKINIAVNRTALSKSNLTASYHLLKVARLVD